MSPKENRFPNPDWNKRRNAISGPSGRSGNLLDPAGEGASGSRKALSKDNDGVEVKRAEEQNKSNSAVSAVTAWLEKLDIPGSDEAKSTQGGEAKKG